jgi:outer membrane protein assembly factor BamB
VVGLDAASGATVWSGPASTSASTPGVAPQLVIAGGKVIYLAPDGSAAALVAADAGTGALLWTTGPGTFRSPPSVCGDARSAVCVAGVLASDPGDTATLRFDIATGRRLAAPTVTGDAPRELGDGLYDAGTREPERLTATRGAKVAWTRPLAKIFPLPGATSDYGWNFGRFERLGLFVGSVGATPKVRRGRDVVDVSRYRTAGFRIADGAVRWRSRGFYSCDLLPCPGDTQAGYSAPEQTQPITVGLRAIERGTVSYSRGHVETPAIVSRDARVTVEGFAPTSGRTLWRFDTGRNTGLLAFTLIPAQVGASTVVLTGAGDKLVSLNLASGARRAVAGDARGWCRKFVTYRQTAGYETAVGTSHTYIGQYALVACAARSQKRLAPPPTVPAWVGDIGARNAGLIAWSDTAGVIAEPGG